jgi:hypothetical protein
VWKPCFIHKSNEFSSAFIPGLGIYFGVVVSTFCGATFKFIVKGWIMVGLPFLEKASELTVRHRSLIAGHLII